MAKMLTLAPEKNRPDDGKFEVILFPDRPQVETR